MVIEQLSILDLPTQRCPRCDQHLPHLAYHPDKRGKPGHYCRPCIADYKREWRRARGIGPRGVKAPPKPKPRTYSTTYRAVHKRVQRIKGSASNHPCAHCQSTAHHWAYDHTDPNELVGHAGSGHTTTYSIKPEHYQPLCRSCHAKQDGGRTHREQVAELQRELAEFRSAMSGFSPARGVPNSPLCSKSLSLGDSL